MLALWDSFQFPCQIKGGFAHEGLTKRIIQAIHGFALITYENIDAMWSDS